MSPVLKRDDLAGRAWAIRPLAEAPAATMEEPAVAPSPPAPDADDRHARLLQRVVAELVQGRARLLEEIRPELLRLVLAIAHEVIGREVQADRSVIEYTLGQALQNLHFATRIVARVHPDDLAGLEQHAAVAGAGSPHLDFVADASIERGGCLLESDRGSMDATMQTQLAALHEALLTAHGAGA